MMDRSKAGEGEVDRRLQELILEQSGTAPTLPTAEPASPAKNRQRRNPLALTGAVALSLLIGLQLGGLPWRYRREIWQVQGAVVGLALGVLIGRFSARRPEP